MASVVEAEARRGPKTPGPVSLEMVIGERPLEQPSGEALEQLERDVSAIERNTMIERARQELLFRESERRPRYREEAADVIQSNGEESKR
jgi:hypothetical protein